MSLNFPSNFSTEVRKVLSKIAKIKGCEAVADWIKPCENHLYWSATSTFNGNEALIWSKFKSFLHHVLDVHSNFQDPLFNRCEHDKLEPRKWLESGT